MNNRNQIAAVAAMLTDDPDIIAEGEMAPIPGEGPPDDVTAQIADITSQPWQRWARVLNVSDLETSRERWDDPGDYPSAVGAGSMDGREGVSGAQMTIVFEIVPQLAALFDQDEQIAGSHPYSEAFENNLTVAADQILAEELPGARAFWNIQRRGNQVVYSLSDVDMSGA